MSNEEMVWYSVESHRPALSAKQKKPNSFGRPVLIWPPHQSDGCADAHVAYYGCRVTDEPSFYLYGRCIEPEYWMPLPSPPSTSSEQS